MGHVLGAGRQQVFDRHPALGVQLDADDIGPMPKDQTQESAGGNQLRFHGSSVPALLPSDFLGGACGAVQRTDFATVTPLSRVPAWQTGVESPARVTACERAAPRDCLVFQPHTIARVGEWLSLSSAIGQQ